MRTLEETIVSECGRYKVEIERRAERVFQITAFKWTEEWVSGIGKVAEFWAQADRMATFTDTIERARELAREDLSARIAGDSYR
jgi:hypothetical protein